MASSDLEQTIANLSPAKKALQSLTVAATFTAEPLQTPLDFWMKRLGIPAKIQFAPFNQVFQQLLDPSSLLASNRRGLNVILCRVEDLVGSEGFSAGDAKDRLTASAEEFVKSLHVAAQRGSAPYLVCLCPSTRVVRAEIDGADACDHVLTLLASKLNQIPGISVLMPSELFALYPVANYQDDYAWHVGRIPYTPAFFTSLATMIARRVSALRSTPQQVIVIDCDQTLWKGDLGEASPSAVEIDHSRRMLQDFMIAQQEAGKVLCICGKQSNDRVIEVLESNPGMRLRWQHITDSRINELPASENLKDLARELGIELDRFIFVSSSPAECAEVRTNGSGVTVAQLPADTPQIPHFLSHFWPFDDCPTVGQPEESPSLHRERFVEIAMQLSTVDAIGEAIESEKVRHSAGRAAYAPPRTGMEELLVDVWARLLRVEQPGIRDNFFALGGHSLLAVQVIARIRQTLGVEMPLRAMFDAPTIAEFAQRLEAARGTRGESATPALTPGTRQGSIPLSYSQQRLWFIDQLEPGNPLYNISVMYRMWGPINVEAMRRTIHEIVRRHESLRTTFPSMDGNPVQVIAPELQIPLRVEVRTGLNEAEREAVIQKFAREEALRPFDLSIGPLLRFSLLQLTENEHVLVVILHHIVGDGWSGSLLAAEMAALYEAFSRNRPSPLPELTIQYADFAIWQRQWMQGAPLEAHLAYWKQHLAGAPPVLELPTDRPRPAVQNHRGSVRTHVVARKLLEQLRTLSQHEGATLFMTLLAAFQLLLSRYSGQEDIVIGSTIAGRNYAEIEPLIGFFVNTLALRADLSGDPTFRELLARVRQVALDAYAHQEIPFEKLVEELQPERSLSYNPIFQVLFGMQNMPRAGFEASGLKVQREPVHSATSLFDVSWFAFETPEGLLLRVEYDTDLFEETTIARALGHFEQILAGIVARPQSRISDLPLLSPEEQHQILVEFNDTAADYPNGFCIHDFLSQKAGQTPDAVALICDEVRITYRELNQRANQVAHFLRKQGAGPEVLVGIYSKRTAAMVVGILGILKAGSAYVPLDPAYPKDRLAHILEDAKAPLVLTQQALLSGLPRFDGRVICMDTEREQIARESQQDPITEVKPENLAYVLFTSGSTGRPKGVALEHHSAVTFIRWANDLLGPQELSGVLFCTSICFDLSTFEMFVTMGAGGKMILAENPLYLPTLPANGEVTLLNTVPSAIAELVRMKGLPDSVKTVVLAGEVLPETLVEEIYSSTSVEKIYNMYGPTEVCCYCTFTLVRRGEPVTIGKPVAKAQAYILDDRRRPVPVGIPGEAYFAGEGVARGYYGRNDLTQERFLPNPFAVNQQSRMYKTGDACRWLADGNLQYLRRLDHQIKLRGFRVELGEIEAALDKHPTVRRSVVVAREDQPGLKRVVAYVVPQTGVAPQPDELREHVKQLLPEYMVPAVVVVLEAFPLTPNGKINRQALPAPEYTRIESDTAFLAPRTPTEEIVAALWAEVLRLDRVGVHDNFFEQGGHSLSATQVVARIRESLAVDLPLRALFEAPTVAGQAERIEELKRQDAGVAFPPLVRAEHKGRAPLSFAQQRLWFLDQLEPLNPLYNVPYIVRLEGPMRSGVLEESLNEIVRRHESLRTCFEELDGEPVQVVEAARKLPLAILDVSSLPPDARLAEARRLAMEEVKRPFDLRTAPLMRGLLIKLADDDHALVLNMHHIITDSWSWGVLLQELAVLYEASLQGAPSPLEELPLQYSDYAIWQRKHMTESWMASQIAYWKKHLEGAPAVLELPTARPRRAMENFWGGIRQRTLPDDLANELRTLSLRHGATLFMTLLAGFQALLARLSGQDDVVVGTDLANRTQFATEKLIGFFVNLLPIRTRMTGDPTFTELLGRVKEVSLGAFAHQDVPFEKLVEELRPERSLTHHPLVQVLFVMQNTPHRPREFGGLKPGPLGVSSTSRFDLVLFINNPDGTPVTTWMYNPNLFDDSAIVRMADLYETLLRSIAAEPEAPLTRIYQTLEDAERRLREAEQKSFQETGLRKLRTARRKTAMASVDADADINS